MFESGFWIAGINQPPGGEDMQTCPNLAVMILEDILKLIFSFQAIHEIKGLIHKLRGQGNRLGIFMRPFHRPKTHPRVEWDGQQRSAPTIHGPKSNGFPAGDTQPVQVLRAA